MNVNEIINQLIPVVIAFLTNTADNVGKEVGETSWNYIKKLFGREKKAIELNRFKKDPKAAENEEEFRAHLSSILFGNPQAKKQLSKILKSKVRAPHSEYLGHRTTIEATDGSYISDIHINNGDIRK